MNVLRNRRTNMDVPIVIGILLALTVSVVETINSAEHTYFDSVVMLLFFLLCGRYLDQAMRRKTRAVASNLASLKAEVAHRIEESLVTGETAHRVVSAGQEVYAGSLNYNGTLTLCVTAAGTGTLLDEVERLLESAATAKSRYVQFADRVARAYAPMV